MTRGQTQDKSFKIQIIPVTEISRIFQHLAYAQPVCLIFYIIAVSALNKTILIPCLMIISVRLNWIVLR